MNLESADFDTTFSARPTSPAISLRGGNCMDDYKSVPAFDPVLDAVTPEYLERYPWGIPYLDSQSWRFYLPHLLRHAVNNLDNDDSMITDYFLTCFRPHTDGSDAVVCTAAERRLVLQVLETLAHTKASVWRDEAQAALDAWQPLLAGQA